LRLVRFAPRNTQPATRNPQCVTRNAQPATRNPQPVSRNPQPATRSAQPATRNAQPATRNPIIIGISASVLKEDKDKVLAGGCDDFVRKPFQVAEIFVKMAKYLEVRYVYRDLQTAGEKPVTAALISADLAGLPEDHVQQINTAAKCALSKKLLDL
jgi:chemotaxis family two-component system sensor kinase Cph1